MSKLSKPSDNFQAWLNSQSSICLSQTVFRFTTHTTKEVKQFGLGIIISSSEHLYGCDPVRPPPTRFPLTRCGCRNALAHRDTGGKKKKTIKEKGGGNGAAACLDPPHAGPRRLRSAVPAEAAASSAPSSPASDGAHAQALVLAQTPPFAQRLPLPHSPKSARAAARAQRFPRKKNK